MIEPFEKIVQQGIDLQTGITELLKLEKPFPERLVKRVKIDDVFAKLIYRASSEKELIPSLLKVGVKQENNIQHSNFELVKNGAKSFINWGVSGFKIASQEVVDERTLICKTCPYISKATDQIAYKFKINANEDMSICSICGCVISRKVALLNKKCPKNKW
ncbi:hypothetical protein [uncultured Tenacibaculum sp.]|uniref:hypothetical protein n=1 Tax=uncultured Tenacibaculum sp. TaxID=174713 RepID=UPI0026098DF6|nr:hypothetical protein [uncultured Tenacibaculum sp.]